MFLSVVKCKHHTFSVTQQRPPVSSQLLNKHQKLLAPWRTFNFKQSEAVQSQIWPHITSTIYRVWWELSRSDSYGHLLASADCSPQVWEKGRGIQITLLSPYLFLEENVSAIFFFFSLIHFFYFCILIFSLNLLECHWLIRLYRFSSVDFYDTSSVYCIVNPPPKVTSFPSPYIWPSLPFSASLCPPLSLW